MATDIDALLGEDDSSAFPSFEEEDAKGALPGDESEEKEDEKPLTASEAKKLREEMALLREQANRPQTQQHQPQATSIPASLAQTPEERQALVKRLEAEFLANPGETILRTLETAQNMAQQAASKAAIPAAQSTARLLAKSFKDSRRGDAYFPDAEKEFDDLVAQYKFENPNVTADQMNEGIETLYQIAVGRSLLKKGSGKRTNPPPYGAGSGIPASKAQSSGGRQLSKAQREMVRSARDEWGYNDDQIRELLKDMDND